MARTRRIVRADYHHHSLKRSCKQDASGNKVLYHCNYCNKDITGVVRIKCHICQDFDLCVECFSVGAVIWPHESSHPYRVISKPLSVPMFSPDWTAEQEMLLLEGISMYGPSDWEEVAVHVATKSGEECAEHYKAYYLSAPNLIPEMKTPEQILAMEKDTTETSFTCKRSETTVVKDNASPMRVRESPGSSSIDTNGYNPKRHEFDVEYDNDAEKLLVDLEFNENDSETIRELKLRVVRAYNKRLDERQRRKDFIIERGLLYPNPVEKDFTPEERELCRKYDPVMRFHSKETHDELLKTIVEEHRIRTRIQELEGAQAAGFHTMPNESEINEHGVGSSSGGLSMPAPNPGPSQKLNAVDFLSGAGTQAGGYHTMANKGEINEHGVGSSSGGLNMSAPNRGPSRTRNAVDILSGAGAQAAGIRTMGNQSEINEHGARSSSGGLINVPAPNPVPSPTLKAVDFQSGAGARAAGFRTMASQSETNEHGFGSSSGGLTNMPPNPGPSRTLKAVDFQSGAGARAAGFHTMASQSEITEHGLGSSSGGLTNMPAPNSGPSQTLNAVDFLSGAGAQATGFCRMANQSEISEHGVGSSSEGLNMPAPNPGSSRTIKPVDFLSRAEKQLCHEAGFSAEFYLRIQEIMAQLIFQQKITNKLDAHNTFKSVQPSKVDKVYDMLVRKGIAPPS